MQAAPRATACSDAPPFRSRSVFLEGRDFRGIDRNYGERGVWLHLAWRAVALGGGGSAPSILFLLLSEGFGANRVSPHSTTAGERDGALGTPCKLDPRGHAARRTRLYGCAGGGTCAGHRGAVEFLAAFHEQRRSRRQQGATYPHRRRAEGFA